MAIVVSRTVFGRDHEWALLLRCLDRTRKGRGAVVALIGEAGIGKSRLAEELLDNADADGHPVLVGRAVDTGTPVPFRPLFEALSGYARTIHGGNVRQRATEKLLARLAPTGSGDHLGDSYRASPMEIAEATLQLVAAIGGDAGCVVVLEDLHWSDPDSIAVLEYIADNIRAVPALCVVTLRPDPEGQASQMVRALAARRSAIVLHLEPLTPDEVAAMTRACLGADEVTVEIDDLVQTFSDGLPLLVEELLDTSIGTNGPPPVAGAAVTAGTHGPAVPERFADLVRQRLARLPDETATALVELAVVAPQAPVPLLRALMDTTTEKTASVLRDGVAHQLLTPDKQNPEVFQFRHALTRDAMIVDLLPLQRRAIATRALTLLDQDVSLDADGELVARLAETANDHDRAADVLLRSARSAVDRGGFLTAAPMLSRARALATTGNATSHAVTLLLIEVLSETGRVDEALDLGRQAAALVRDGSAVDLHLATARAAIMGGVLYEADTAIRAARFALRNMTDPGRRAALDLVQARVARERGELDDALALARASLGLAEQVDDQAAISRALEVLAACHRGRGDLDAAEHHIDRMVMVAGAHDLPALHRRGMVERVVLDAWRGSYVQLPATRQEAVDAGALVTVAHLDNYEAWIALDRWDTGVADEAAVRCVELARRFRNDGLLAIAQTAQARAAAQRGDRQQMERLLAEASRIGAQSPDVMAAGSAARVDYWCRRDDLDRASRELEQAMTHLRVSAIPAQRGLRLLFKVVGDPGDPSSFAEFEAGPAGDHFANIFYRHHAVAVRLGREGDGQQAMEELRCAQDGPLGAWPLHHARRLIAASALAHGWGEPVVWLRDAESYFATHGFDEIAAGCRRELAQAGVPVGRRSRAGQVDRSVPVDLRSHGVTAREAQVLALLAEARSTREIAEQLFISPKTVERHTSNLATKLDLDGRAEVVAFGARRASST